MLNKGCLLFTSPVCWFDLEADHYSVEQNKRNVRCWHWAAIYNSASPGEEAEFLSHVDLDSLPVFSLWCGGVSTVSGATWALVPVSLACAGSPGASHPPALEFRSLIALHPTFHTIVSSSSSASR